MNKETILTEIQSIFRTIFKNDQLQITTETAQPDIDQWDSLNHAMLIDAVEKKYDIKFDLMDMLGIQSVGDICDKVMAKTKS